MANKYHAKKTVVEGITFDSKVEAQRYQELRLLEKEGDIWNLRTHIIIPLLPTQSREYDMNERKVTYNADFIYHTMIDGQERIVIEDVKGSTKGMAYTYWTLKRKILKFKYPEYVIREVINGKAR